MANVPYGFNPDILLSYPNASAPGFPATQAYPVSENRTGYYWCSSNADCMVPNNAVVGGVDQDGTTIYVGRSFHEGDYIPAKVIPSKQTAYVAYGGGEHAKYEYEILCEQRFDWVPCMGGSIPHNAVEGGRTSDGERLFIGRVNHDGSLTVGKVHPSHGCLYIPFGGEELKYDEYEILIMQ